MIRNFNDYWLVDARGVDGDAFLLNDFVKGAILLHRNCLHLVEAGDFIIAGFFVKD